VADAHPNLPTYPAEKNKCLAAQPSYQKPWVDHEPPKYVIVGVVIKKVIVGVVNNHKIYPQAPGLQAAAPSAPSIASSRRES